MSTVGMIAMMGKDSHRAGHPRAVAAVVAVATGRAETVVGAVGVAVGVIVGVTVGVIGQVGPGS